MVCQPLYLLLVIIVCGLFTACKHDRPFILDGEVKDGGSGKVYLYRYGNKNFRLIDSISYTDGKFRYAGVVNQPLLYGISVRRDDLSPQTFFVGEDTLHLAFWKTGVEVLTQDSPLNDAYLSMREQAKGATEQAILRYVSEHKDSPVTAFFALHEWSWRLDLSTLKLIISALEPTLSDCIYFKDLQDVAQQMEHVQPGCPAPAIKNIPADGRQYTVLVFFASWCPDCRVELPAIETAAAKMKQTRFVGISLDTQKTPLEAFKQQHGALFETIISDYKGWDSPLVRIFAVRWIPTFFLLSPDGKILKVSHSAKDLV